jgi:hypothetical protein
MHMKTIILFAFVLLGLSCNTSENGKSDVAALPGLITPELAGTAYHFPPPPGLDTSSCAIQYGVDGPDWYLIFTDEKRFIELHHGMWYETIYTGEYLLKESELFLNYDSISVTETQEFKNDPAPDGKTYVISNVTEYTFSNQRNNRRMLHLHTCGERYYLKTIREGSEDSPPECHYDRGMQDTIHHPDFWLKKLENDSAWIKLKLWQEK